MVHFYAGTFSDTKALGKPNMVWFISLQGTNNFTNIWLYWRTSTTVTLHRKHISIPLFNNTGFVGWKRFPAALVRTLRVTGGHTWILPGWDEECDWGYLRWGQGAGEGESNKTQGAKPEPSEIKVVWREGYRRPDRKLRRDPLDLTPRPWTPTRHQWPLTGALGAEGL